MKYRAELDALLERIEDPRGEYPSSIAIDCQRMMPSIAKHLRGVEDTTRQLLAAYDELQAHPTGNNLAAAVQVHIDELRALVEGKSEELKP